MKTIHPAGAWDRPFGFVTRRRRSQQSRPAHPSRMRIALASTQDRLAIAQLRHAVYAEELQQYPIQPDGRLMDPSESNRIDIAATLDGSLAGYISLTPPSAPQWALEKYLAASDVPIPRDPQTYEVRLLTVNSAYRRRRVGSTLMYAAFRWIEAHGGTHIIAVVRAPT